MHFINRKKGKKGFMAIKIDMAKTYDHVDWHFLKKVIVVHGFPISFYE